LVENERRSRQLVGLLEGVVFWEADVGKNEIVENGLNTSAQCFFYVLFSDERTKSNQLQSFRRQFSKVYPMAKLMISRAKNPYDQLFGSSEPYASLRLRTIKDTYLNKEAIHPILDESMVLGEGFQMQSNVLVDFDRPRLYAYGLTEDQVIQKLKIQLSDHLVTTVNKVNEAIPIVVRGNGKISREEMDLITVWVHDTIQYPISHFFRFQASQSQKFITADKVGIYQEVRIPTFRNDLEDLLNSVRSFVQRNGWILSVSGQFLDSKANFLKLAWSFVLAVVLLYVILTAQFESFKLPIIILSEIPVSTSGSALFLWLFGETINVSSLIGLVIMLGIIVNDSILKVDTINRYRKRGYETAEAIRIGGIERLKPILMTTLTTVLVLVPVLFSSGFGADLNRPLAVSVVGGLLVGTLCSIYLVPMLYGRLMKERF